MFDEFNWLFSYVGLVTVMFKTTHNCKRTMCDCLHQRWKCWTGNSTRPSANEYVWACRSAWSRGAVKRHQRMSLTAATAKQRYPRFETVCLIKISTWHASFLPTVGQNRNLTRAFMNWLPPLTSSHIGSTMSPATDKRSTGCHHSSFPTLTQQWVQLVTKDINLATQRRWSTSTRSWE